MNIFIKFSNLAINKLPSFQIPQYCIIMEQVISNDLLWQHTQYK